MRKAYLERNTKETQIKLSINLDGVGSSEINTGRATRGLTFTTRQKISA